MKLTFGTVKAACAKVLNKNQDSPVVLDYVNRAQERLLYDGKWVETMVRYAVCVRNGCIVWPREIETIEAWEQCGWPGEVRNHFYEFLGYGPGSMSPGYGLGSQLIDRGNAVAFDDVVGTSKRLAIYADGDESAASPNYVILRYYDGNGNKIFTNYGGTVIEGERVTIPAAGQYSYTTNYVMQGGLYEVIKPVTKKPIRLYEYTEDSDVIGTEEGDIIGTEGGDSIGVGGGSAGTYRALGYYEPDETLPTYRRSLIPCLAGTSEGGCSTQRITVLAKRRFIPAIDDNSVLIISHADAVRLACQAIKKEEDVGVLEAEPLWQMAIRCLGRQLRHWQGDGVAAPINFAGMDSPVCNII